MAFIAVPRIVLAVGPDPDEPHPGTPGAQMIMASLKYNLSAPITPLAYAILPEGPWGKFVWRDPRPGVSVEALFDGPPQGRRGDGDEDKAKADAFVTRYLADGLEHASSALLAAGQNERLTRASLYESRARLCVSRRHGYGPGGAWYVRLKPEYRPESLGALSIPPSEIYGDAEAVTPLLSTTSSLISTAEIYGRPKIYGDARERVRY